MSHAFMGLGSNLGHRKHNILTAWQRLTSLPGCHSVMLSSPYLSKPVGIPSKKWFINAVGVLDTALRPAQLLTEMLAIESAMGRDRSQGDDRSIDLDLLYYDDLIVEEESLSVPHPAVADRLFVLLPLGEVAPDFNHPILGRTSDEMLRRLDSREIVKKVSWNRE